MTHLFLDFETRSTVDLKKAGLDVYARHPTTDVMCVGWAYGDEPVEVFDRETAQRGQYDLLNFVMDGVTVIAHNAPFELAIWNEVMVPRYGWPTLKPEQVVCTMAMAYAMALPGSLEKAAAAVGIDQQKDMAGNRIMLQLAKPRAIKEDGTIVWWNDPAKLEKLYAYCKQDVKVERELYKRLVPLSDQERKIWLLDYRINQRGVAVDRQAVEAAIKIVEAEKRRLDKAMRDVTGNSVVSCSAISQLTDWLRWKGVKADGVAKADVVDLLEQDDLPSECRQALLLRQEAAKSSTAKLEAMTKGVCDDGRMRGLFQYHGAATGRWAGRRVQLQNLPRPKLGQKEIEDVFEILGGVG